MSLESPVDSVAIPTAQAVPGIDIIVFAGKSDIIYRKDWETTKVGNGAYPTRIASASGRIVCLQPYNNVLIHADPHCQFRKQWKVPWTLGCHFRRHWKRHFVRRGQHSAWYVILVYGAPTYPRSVPNYVPTPYSLSVRQMVIDTYNQASSTIGSTVIGRTNTYLNSTKAFIRYFEAPVGNFATDALRDHTGTLSSFILNELGTQIAFMNAGALRVDIPIGDITSGTVFALLPFTNYVQSVTMSAYDLVEVLQLSVDQVHFENDPTKAPNDGRFLHVVCAYLTRSK